MNRRDMLAVLMAGPFALELERVRLALDGVSSAPASERDADEWERVAALYACEVQCSPHARYLPHLLADAAEVTERVRSASGAVRARLLRSAARIAALAAMGLGAMGEPMPAAHWWRTAARVAGEAGDGDLTALILPADWRQHARVLSAARGALATVPAVLAGRQSVREAHEVLALPA